MTGVTVRASAAPLRDLTVARPDWARSMRYGSVVVHTGTVSRGPPLPWFVPYFVPGLVPLRVGTARFRCGSARCRRTAQLS